MFGILRLTLGEQDVLLFTEKEAMHFKTLDDFIDYDFGSKGINVFATLNEINSVYLYLKEKEGKKYCLNKLEINKAKKIVGFSIHCADKYRTNKNGQKNYYPFKTFYDLKYKLGTDELSVEDSLREISKLSYKNWNQGYTSQLRNRFKDKIGEQICKETIENPPSMSPIVFTKINKELVNVWCYDITSAYPYLLTQPLPHYLETTNFISEEQFKEDNCTYYGGLKITNLQAKQPYFPLTLVGNIAAEKQGKNIIHHGVRIESADEIILCGFIPHLLQLLKANYTYDSYIISKKVLKFELRIEPELRKEVISLFEAKQNKKRKGLNYTGEKILLNRIYGFLITKGNSTPAHFGQYIVSKERLIIDNMVRKIGLEDMVQSHTDSIKFTGNHAAAIEEYNNTIEFPELGKFSYEGTFERCFYFSNIVAKYIQNGELKFKHGGISSIGMGNLYKMNYDDIVPTTKFYLITGYFYSKEGYFPVLFKTDFTHSTEFDLD